MGTDNIGHRAGALKQTNKSHKTGRHRSKGAIDNDQKGNSTVRKCLVYIKCYSIIYRQDFCEGNVQKEQTSRQPRPATESSQPGKQAGTA